MTLHHVLLIAGLAFAAYAIGWTIGGIGYQLLAGGCR